MKVKEALDAIVDSLRSVESCLAGDDSYLKDPWEEIKEQLQNGLSAWWPQYLNTMKSTVKSQLASLSSSEFAELANVLKCGDEATMREKLLQRLIARGRREKVMYEAFEFVYFRYPAFDFIVYGRVIERIGYQAAYVEAFSVAAPYGERGRISTNRIEAVLTEVEFERARAAGWPEN